MKTVGLITEYNPFHNGHLYHIERARELTGADRVVIVMSGDYVQRGTPALLSKHSRAHMALLNGASAICELPVCYASGSAEFFAQGAISILEGLGCIDTLCFGSECGELSVLQHIAQLLLSESDTYSHMLQDALKKGHSFPAARHQALEKLTGDASVSQILSEPNNILGIEYLKALKKQNSRMVPYTLKRDSSGYHDTKLQPQSSSASAIRNALRHWEEQPFSRYPADPQQTPHGFSELLQNQLPENALRLLRDAWNQSCPIETNDFSLLLKYRLLCETRRSLCEYQDISEDLANRIIRNRNQFLNFEQFCQLLKTKELTYSRISRGLLHILLAVKKEDMLRYRESSCIYTRILGFRKEHADVLRQIKENASIPVITKLGQTDSLLPETIRMLDQTTFASDLYESVVSDKFGIPFINEYQKQIIHV